MRAIISAVNPNRGDARNGYIGHSIRIDDWFCEQNEIPDTREVTLVRMTEKAYLFMIKNKERWIPRSVCEIKERQGAGLERFEVKE